jgi:hypothetical protein
VIEELNRVSRVGIASSAYARGGREVGTGFRGSFLSFVEVSEADFVSA